MRHKCNIYEYVAIYVDYLLCAMKDPRTFLDNLIQVYKYKLKGNEPLQFLRV